MKKVLQLAVVVILFAVATPAWAWQNDDRSVPRFVRFTGTLSPAYRESVVPITFAIYSDAQGGAPLWSEAQSVPLNANGRYTILLGSASSEGLPAAIFATNEARWLGVQVLANAEPEQQRILLVSVPYALKAQDADRLGGRSLGDFVLQSTLDRRLAELDTPSSAGKRSGAGKTTAAASTFDVYAASFTDPTAANNYKWLELTTAPPAGKFNGTLYSFPWAGDPTQNNWIMRLGFNILAGGAREDGTRAGLSLDFASNYSPNNAQTFSLTHIDANGFPRQPINYYRAGGGADSLGLNVSTLQLGDANSNIKAYFGQGGRFDWYMGIGAADNDRISFLRTNRNSGLNDGGGVTTSIAFQKLPSNDYWQIGNSFTISHATGNVGMGSIPVSDVRMRVSPSSAINGLDLFASAPPPHFFLRATVEGVDRFKVDGAGNTTISGTVTSGLGFIGNLTGTASLATAVKVTDPGTYTGGPFTAMSLPKWQVPQAAGLSNVQQFKLGGVDTGGAFGTGSQGGGLYLTDPLHSFVGQTFLRLDIPTALGGIDIAELYYSGNPQYGQNRVGPFTMTYGKFPNTACLTGPGDHVVRMNWNGTSGGASINPYRPSFGIAFEESFQPDNCERTQPEFYIDYVSAPLKADGSVNPTGSVTIRPLTGVVNWDQTTDTYNTHVRSETNLFMIASPATAVGSPGKIQMSVGFQNQYDIFYEPEAPSSNALVSMLRTWDNGGSQSARFGYQRAASNPYFTSNRPIAATGFQGPLTGNVTGNLTGTASLATAFAANPADCLTARFATAIAANGDLTCAAIQPSDLPSLSGSYVDLSTNQTIAGIKTFSSLIQGSISGNAATATAFAADPADCLTARFATAIAANGDLTCAAIQASDLPSLSGTYVDLSTNQTIAGIKTFSSVISGDISGNAATATVAGALAANPTDCSTGFAKAIDAQGNLTCAAIQAGDVPDLSGSYVNLASAQTVAGNKTFSGTLTTTGPLAAGQAYSIQQVVPFSATPTFNAGAGNNFKLTLTANVTGSQLTNAVAGQTLVFLLCQDATGGRAFTWPANFKGAMVSGGQANKCSIQQFYFDGTDAYALTSGLVNQ